MSGFANVRIRGYLWQVLWWPRLTIKRGVWPKGRSFVVFRWWIVGPIEVRRYELPEAL